MGLVDVERIRVSAERDAYAVLERLEASAKRTYVAPDVSAKRRTLLSNALLLTETMAPAAYQAAHEAMTALGVDEAIELFQSAGHGRDNARLVLYGHPIGVEFIGAYLDTLDHGALLAVLGHEIGHRLAHSGHAMFGWASAACESGPSPVKRAYSMATEFTADRFGLLACRDLDAALRLEMQASAGGSSKRIQFDTTAYLAQCQAVAEETIASGGIAMGSTHPEHYIRGYAEWLFSETDIYRSLTGEGSGSRSLDEVDAVIQKLIGSPNPRTVPTTTAKPSPRASTHSATNPTEASVGSRDDEAAARAASPQETLEDLATDILTDGARRKLAATRSALAAVARAAAPSIRRLADAAREQVGSTESQPDLADDARDPLEEERRALIARFDELERRLKDR